MADMGMLADRMSRNRAGYAAVLMLVGATGCGPALSASDLPAENEGGTLSGAVLLPLTSRSSEGLLGNVWSPQSHRVESSRHVLTGAARHEETRQHVEVLRSVDLLASLGIAAAGIGAKGALKHHTDVAYSVDITGYETLSSDAKSYASDSGCCVDGRVSKACEGGYVGRLLRGSGKLKYLRRLEGNASANAGPVLSALGGARYELLDETTFVDAFFAFVPERLDELCGRISPEQEMAPIQVAAPENCIVRLYTATSGSHRAHATYYPTADACWTASAAVCTDPAKTVVACPVTYRQTDGTVTVRDLASQARTAGALPANAGAEAPNDPAQGRAGAAAARESAVAPTAASAAASTRAGSSSPRNP